MWVLDTNTLIYFFRGEGNVPKEILARSPSAIGIPSIVLYELEVGIAKSTSPRKRMGQLEELIAVVQTLPFGAAEARVSAAIRSSLEKKGKPIGPYDVLIAGTAKACNATLVTRNTREFKRVQGLVLENWY
jgi:tRNA(fMet)-specific endonuclease VapC